MKDILDQRHPIAQENGGLWQFYHDHYQGGALWPFSINPINPASPGRGATIMDVSNLGNGKYGASRYLWQYPLEKTEKYLHRLARAAYINILSPVVDFYASTVGKAENVLIEVDDDSLQEFEDNCDLQGQSFSQFMARARTNAEIYGHTFLFVDSTRAYGELKTQRDAQEQGIRGYLCEITPPNLCNWRLDKNGAPLELTYKTEVEVAGNIMDKGSQTKRYEYRYWSRTEWIVFSETDNGEYTETARGNHTLGLVPIVPLYHRREKAFLGRSLLTDAAKLSQLCTNWVSALDEAFETQMFAIPVWKSKESPVDSGVGSATVLHLNPDKDEEFSYVTPDTQPFTEGWAAFYRLIQMANKHMGIAPKAITSEKIDTQSGVSKEWDFVEAEKILSTMALNEQEAAIAVFGLVAAWNGGEFNGSIQYATKYDLSTATEDINDLIALQAAGVPKTARQELMRRCVRKKLTSLPAAVQAKIDKEIDALGEFVDPAVQIASDSNDLKKTLADTAKPAAAAGAKGGKTSKQSVN